MASFDYRLNPVFTIKECSSCGAWYNKSCGCSKGCFVDKFVINSNKTPDLSQQTPNCPKCGNPVEGLYCRQCAPIRKKLEEVFQDFQDTSESSNNNTNVVNEPQEPFVVKQDPGKNSSPSPPQIDHCCHECGDSLDGIFCRQCTCKSCGKGAHYGYNCPPKVPIISNPEPCNNQTIAPRGIPDIKCLSSGGQWVMKKRRGTARECNALKITLLRFVNSTNDNSRGYEAPYGEDIDYVDASPPDAEIVSLEVVEIVVPEVGGIDTDILLTIKDDILREKLLNVNLLIANIEALKDNLVPPSDVMTKSSSTSLNLFLEETNCWKHKKCRSLPSCNRS
ncbi:hypothetical protein Tco_0034377 [Tanacetum coccineum]